ncbi:hypothetical protein [Stenotrophomonas forensis]|uniref:Transmembrane protein n=1 Tax=Stenotrophomonas forensis TaxID=2871169 RepID=A0ABY7XX25_9GAMM|nr:hypothetical protein [Stenotrophomonas sp. DFS-20110405]WDM62270.1 hypothetical protein K5L94_14180 [Stenotrophomonas sp. DFS-20110405]
MTRQATTQSSEWDFFQDLKKEAWQRTCTPFRSPSFLVFFAIAVVGLGALGIWLEIYSLILPEPPALRGALNTTDNGLSSLRAAILTFFPAVAGTSAMQLIWAEKLKHFRSASILLLFIFLVSALITSPSRVPDFWALLAGTLMSILSMWVWWIANATQPDLLDKRIDLDSAVGGEDVTAPMQGNTEGFKT